MKTFCLLSTTLFLTVTQGLPAKEEAPWRLSGPGKPIKVIGKVLDPLNVSGSASIQGGLILACDELHHGVQAGRLDLTKGEIAMDEKEFPLLENAKKELDLEGAAADPEHHRYYASGSCSVKRSSGNDAPDRQWLFSFEADAKTGAPLAGKVSKVSLKDAMKADAFLAEHMDKSAEDLGIDVEGLAFKDGRLWFGLRSPNVNGWGFVVAASATDLMAKKPVVFQRFELPLGEDLGIRDIAPLKDGFLLITGPTGANEKPKPESKAKPAEEAAKAAPAKKEKEKPKDEETVATALAAKPAGGETVAKAEPAKKPAVETVAKAAPVAKSTEETVAKAAPTAKPDPKTEASPAPQKEPGFALYFWAGDTSRPVRIGDLERPDKGQGKPEGLLVTSDAAEKLSVIVFSDDAGNGAPTLYDLTRPKRVEGPVSRNGK